LFNSIFYSIPCQFKIFDHSPGNSISEGLTGADYIYTIMEFFTDHRFDTGGTDIKGDIIMFLQLVCLLASFFSFLYIQFTLYLIYCELFRENSPVKKWTGNHSSPSPKPDNTSLTLPREPLTFSIYCAWTGVS